MNHSKFRGSMLYRAVAQSLVALVCVFTIFGCVEVDSTLGSDLVPESQKLRFATVNLNSCDDGVEYFTTRLFRSDSISTSNQSYLYMGALADDNFGVSTAGFFVQHTPANTLEEEFFGYLPIIDSVMIMLSVADMRGDSTFVQTYEVYEVVDDSFIAAEPDSVFLAVSLNGAAPLFNIEDYTDMVNLLFTFDFPDVDNEVYPSTSRVRMAQTDKGLEYLRRLMFVDDNREYTEDSIGEDFDGDGVIDTADIREAYTDNELWLSRFKGLYVRPTKTPTTSEEGAIYASDISTSGLVIYGRSLEEDDPTIVKDTIGMSYRFYPIDTASDDDMEDGIYLVGGELSINNLSHDYSSSTAFDYDSQVATLHTTDIESIPTASTIYVQGMAGVGTQITLAEELFLRLDTLLDEEYDSSGDEFGSIFFNQAMLRIYLTKEAGVEPDPLDINSLVITPWLDSAPTSLGLYSQYTAYVDDDGYTTLVGVSDYNYYYELLGYTLDFGGLLNRSWGCYSFNIAGHLQLAWNSFLEAKEAAGDDTDKINWDDVEYRTFYLAQSATSLLSFHSVALQSMTWEDLSLGELIPENNAPMEMSLAYTMID